MDPVSAFSTVVTTVKTLSDINEKVKNAEFKALLADLSVQLSELKMRLADVMNENTELKDVIKNFEHPQYDACPHCMKKSWRLESSRPDKDFGDMGGVIRTYKCSECSHTEDKFSA